jgi:hypothetical protein
LSNVRQEDSRYFWNKMGCLKDNINKLESKSKHKNCREMCRGINKFNKVYQPRTNLVNDERDDLFVDPQKSLKRQKN